MSKAIQTWITGTAPQEPDEHPEINEAATLLRDAIAAKKEASEDEKEAKCKLGAALAENGIEMYKFRDADGNLVIVHAEAETKITIKTVTTRKAAASEDLS